jgi:membrane protein YdbS with pleckstrin-like domain
MTYAAVTGIASYRRMVFANRFHKVALTAALTYITASVPLHLYVAFVLGDVSFYVHMAGYWFSYVLLILVYPAFLTMLWRLQYRN